MSTPRSVSLYSALLRCYPRNFRDEYGPDMALLFQQQLRDEHTPRVWARTVVDLATTVPARHLEVRMQRPPNRTVPIVYTLLSTAGLVVAIVGGASLGVAAVGLGVAVIFGILAVSSWRQTRVVRTGQLDTNRWWVLLVGGVLALATIIVVTTITGELPEGAWAPVMILGLASLLSVVAGVILGIVHFAGDRPRNAAN